MTVPPKAHITSWEASAVIVGLFVPEADPNERQIRARIHNARDRARARSERCDSWEGSRICRVAAEVAGEWVFRPGVELDSLNEVLAALTLLAIAAGKFDRLETTLG